MRRLISGEKGHVNVERVSVYDAGYNSLFLSSINVIIPSFPFLSSPRLCVVLLKTILNFHLYLYLYRFRLRLRRGIFVYLLCISYSVFRIPFNVEHLSTSHHDRYS